MMSFLSPPRCMALRAISRHMELAAAMEANLICLLMALRAKQRGG